MALGDWCVGRGRRQGVNFLMCAIASEKGGLIGKPATAVAGREMMSPLRRFST